MRILNTIREEVRDVNTFSTFVPLLKSRSALINKKYRSLDHLRDSFLEYFFLLREDLRDASSLSGELLNHLRGLTRLIDRNVSEIMDDINGLYDSDYFLLDVIPGIGGREAEHFSRELLDIYLGILNLKFRDFKTVDGGLLIGKQVADRIVFEAGVHRVQRIPVTESSGRLHTSTVIVKVEPYLENFEIRVNESDIKMETMRSSGPGGQHVNKTSSAVRLRHLPTNTMCRIDTTRSQDSNRKLAMDNLECELRKLIREKVARIKDQNRKDYLKFSDRSDKIRTYNFPQDRIVDHRINARFNLKSCFYNAENFLAMIDEVREGINPR